MADDATIRTIEATLREHPRVAAHMTRVHLGLRDEAVVLDGVVGDIGARRLIPHVVADTIGELKVVDRLRVAAGERQSDEALATAVQRALAGEPVFSEYRVAIGHAADDQTAQDDRATDDREVVVSADDGVVRLDGTVGSLSHRRLAEVLAWWTRGCTDVDNRLRLSPEQEDNDAEITDAVRIVLEKDPWLDAAQVHVETHDRVVRLRGMLPGEEQKRMAEKDAWYVDGVRDVENSVRTSEQSDDEQVDEASRESFPASDPPATTPVTGAGKGRH